MKLKIIPTLVWLLICFPLFLYAADYYVLTGATDPGDYANCNGNYYIEGYSIGSRPVYKHDTYDFYIWWDAGYWVIDKDLVAGIAGFFETNSDPTPPETSYGRDTASGDNPTLTKVAGSTNVTFVNGANGTLNFVQTSGSAPETDWLCGQFSITGDETGATFNSVIVTLGGTYDSGDLQSTPFRIYAANSNNFGSASAIGNNTADPGSGNNVTFSSLNDAIPSGTRYYWVTADISATATSDDTINGIIDSSGDLNISSGTITGSSTYGKLNAGSDGSLPVSFSSFSAQSEAQSVVLKWITESETENAGFILERSIDKTVWITIASYVNNQDLLGQGNTSEQSEYQFTDVTTLATSTYFYRLSTVSTAGEITTYPAISVILSDLRGTTYMEDAYPNPFNPQTYIQYHLAKDSDVSIQVYDLLGREIKTLYKGIQGAGSYTVFWNGLTNEGVKVASGSYLIQLHTPAKNQYQKVILMK